MSEETKARIRRRLREHYAAPENIAAARARMARPGVAEKIAAHTAAALAEPDVKARHKAGLARAWTPEKRAAQAELTRERMAAWRARKLEEAAVVLQQMPRAERDVALSALGSVLPGGRIK